MKIEAARYTSGRIALANLSASIESLERFRVELVRFDELATLSELLLLRGDLRGRIADHDRAEAVAEQAAALCPDTARALVLRARLAERFHRFGDAHALLDRAVSCGGANRQTDAIRAALFQATGRFSEALALRERLARADCGIDTLGALASLWAEMGRSARAEEVYAEALAADEGVSPLPCAQLLFAWGVAAMRRGELERAEAIFVQLETVLPGHVPGRGHRAEVALARGEVDAAAALVEPLLAISDDPEYLAIHAEILAASGKPTEARQQAQRAAAAYETLLARRPEAYADHAAAFFLGTGGRPLRALELARQNRALRDTPRSRALFTRAWQAAAASGATASGATASRHQVADPGRRSA